MVLSFPLLCKVIWTNDNVGRNLSDVSIHCKHVFVHLRLPYFVWSQKMLLNVDVLTVYRVLF